MKLIITIREVCKFERKDLILAAGDTFIIGAGEVIVDHRIRQGEIVDRERKTDTSVDRRNDIFSVLFDNKFISCHDRFQVDLIIGIGQRIVVYGKASYTVRTAKVQGTVVQEIPGVGGKCRIQAPVLVKKCAGIFTIFDQFLFFYDIESGTGSDPAPSVLGDENIVVVRIREILQHADRGSVIVEDGVTRYVEVAVTAFYDSENNGGKKTFRFADMTDDTIVFDDIDSVTVGSGEDGSIVSFDHGKDELVVQSVFFA